MNRAGLETMLLTLGIPVADTEFEKRTLPPFLVYLYDGSSDIMADNHNYKEVGNYRLELYTRNKDPVLQGQLENLLKTNRLPYEKRELFIADQNTWETVYEIQII